MIPYFPVLVSAGVNSLALNPFVVADKIQDVGQQNMTLAVALSILSAVLILVVWIVRTLLVQQNRSLSYHREQATSQQLLFTTSLERITQTHTKGFETLSESLHDLANRTDRRLVRIESRMALDGDALHHHSPEPRMED